MSDWCSAGMLLCSVFETDVMQKRSCKHREGYEAAQLVPHTGDRPAAVEIVA